MSSVPRFYEKVLTAVTSEDPAKTSRRLRDIFGPDRVPLRQDLFTSIGRGLALDAAAHLSS